MTTTRQLAKIASVAEQTVRNYADRYGELLSPEARGERGNRRFSDEDVQVFLSIVGLRRQDVPPDEVIERLKRGDIYIEATRRHTTQAEAHQATPSPQAAPGDALMLPMMLSGIEARLAAVERAQANAEAQRVERSNLLITGIVIGCMVTFFVVALALTLFN